MYNEFLAAVEAGASQLYSVLYHPPVSLQSTG
uniref:Radical SAM protein n=1 Tax=Heterorhabditis bacteriophora TaxID=37862 RepID=A0A1I7X576_HETBA